MKNTLQKSHPSVIVVHGQHAKQVIRSLELSRGNQPLTVNGAIEQWAAWLNKNANAQSVAQSVNYVRAWARDMELATTPINDIEEEHLNDWINADDAGQRSTRTVKLARVRSFFKFLAIKELLSGPNPSTLASVNYNALSHAQKETKEMKAFTSGQFLKLINHLDEGLRTVQPQIEASKSSALTSRLLKKRDYFLFWKSASVISRCAGLRMGDICQLEWDTLGKKFTVWTDKRNKRVQPHLWNPDLFNETVAQIPTDDDHYCFPEQRATYLNPKLRATLNTQFSRLCKSLKLKGLTFHSLRHTYATECNRAGIETPHIAQSMGHSNTKTTEGYIH